MPWTPRCRSGCLAIRQSGVGDGCDDFLARQTFFTSEQVEDGPMDLGHGNPAVQDRIRGGLFARHGDPPATVWHRVLKQASLKVGKRSEEHTSELQSLMRISYAVFCLKKKNKKTQQH